MKQRLELRQRQNQEFNTRFSTAVRILQMPISELTDEIRDVLDSNPLLEEIESLYPFNDLSNVAAHGNNVQSEGFDSYEASSGDGLTLQEHLRSQFVTNGLFGRRRLIAETIVDAVDERGYLSESIEDLCEILSNSTDLHEVESVLTIVQQLEPPGVAARNLRECLQLQLNHIAAPSDAKQDARAILHHHMELLANFEMNKLQQAVRRSENAVQVAVNLIRSLNPSPGNQFGKSACAVIPDVVVQKIDGKWKVELNLYSLPKLRISPSYRAMAAKENGSETNRYLKKNLVNASEFLDNMKRRHETVLRVARSVVRHQHPFLEFGERAMQPLTLREVAREVDLHESTVSRACSSKYIMTPRGTYELRSLFSKRIRRMAGADESAQSVKHRLQQMIEQEDQCNPLSDQQITNRLLDDGIQIARRTVAKYRVDMHIPSGKKRKAIARSQISQGR